MIDLGSRFIAMMLTSMGPGFIDIIIYGGQTMKYGSVNVYSANKFYRGRRNRFSVKRGTAQN